MKWFIERVLPGLVAGALVSLLVWFSSALQSSLSRISQSWLPKGSVLLVQVISKCPDGWLDAGLVHLVEAPSGPASSVATYFQHADPNGLNFGLVNMKVCILSPEPLA
jgi:hypothetical protein